MPVVRSVAAGGVPDARQSCAHERDAARPEAVSLMMYDLRYNRPSTQSTTERRNLAVVR